MSERGPMVVLCGMDACGKGTQADTLSERFNALKVKFPTYSFHNDGTLGPVIEQHLKGKWRVDRASVAAWPEATREGLNLLDALVFQCVQSANKYEMAPMIRKTLDIGIPVICDRYWQSGYAYGKADGLDADWLVRVHEQLPQGDFNLLLDIPFAESLARRPDRRDRYEVMGAPYFQQIRDNYLELWAMGAAGILPGKWVVIDGTRPQDEVTLAILDVLAGE